MFKLLSVLFSAWHAIKSCPVVKRLEDIEAQNIFFVRNVLLQKLFAQFWRSTT